MPFFSIILPTYNRAGFLPETIKSVLVQTFTDWELIIVDDGSTDNTKSVVESFIKIDSRIKYVWQKNAERSAARNHGIRLAKGEYICFLDSDDRYLSNHLIELRSFIDDLLNKKCLIFTNYILNQNRELKIPYIEHYENEIIFFLENPVIPSRVCINRKILSDYKFREDIVIVEDTVLWIEIAVNYSVLQLNKNTVVYNLHEDNSVNLRKNCFKPRLDGLFKLFMLSGVKEIIPTQKQKYHISECYYGIAKHYYLQNDTFKMLINIVSSLVTFPFSYRSKTKIYLLKSYFFGPRITEF